MEKEKTIVGEVAIGYLLVKLVEKNVITGDEAKDIISKSHESFSANNKFKDSREILLHQSGALKDDDTLDELLAHIYQERGRSITE